MQRAAFKIELPSVWVSWHGEHREYAEGGETESWRGTSVSEGTTPRVAKPRRWMVALVAFSLLVCAPPALCESDKKPLAKKKKQQCLLLLLTFCKDKL